MLPSKEGSDNAKSAMIIIENTMAASKFESCKVAAAIGDVKGTADKKEKRQCIGHNTKKTEEDIGRFVTDTPADAEYAQKHRMETARMTINLISSPIGSS